MRQKIKLALSAREKRYEGEATEENGLVGKLMSRDWATGRERKNEAMLAVREAV